MSAATEQATGKVRASVPDADEIQVKKTFNIEVPWRRIGIYVVLAFIFFLLGAIPMWNKARDHAAERETAQRELRLSRIENFLASAVIDAGRGEYEPARQMTSDFFTSVRTQIDRAADSDMSTSQREKVKLLLTQRDELITLLARSDPAVVSRLSDLYVTYRSAISESDPVVTKQANQTSP